MSPVVQIILLTPLGFLLYAGSIPFWPIYRVRHRKRTRRGRALFRMFLIQLSLYIVWSSMLIISALQHGDWLHGVTLYIIMNVIFLLVGWAVWSSTDDTEISTHVTDGS